MLGLPSSTVFEHRVPKNRITEAFPPRSALKRVFTEQVDSIHWRHSLTQSSLRLPEGRTVREIDVLEVVFRSPSLPLEVLRAIDGVLPRPIVFVVASPVERLLAMSYKELRPRPNRPPKIEVDKLFTTPLPDPDAPVLTIEGLDLDAVRDAFLRQIAGEALPFPRDLQIQDALRLGKERDALLRKIAALDNKIRREKQFNRQIELRDEKKILEKELRVLTSIDDA